MIEELNLIKAIVGDLSGVGLWVFLGTISYMLITKMVLYVGLGYLVKLIAGKVAEYFKADITKAEAEELESENDRLKKDADAARTEADRQRIIDGASVEALKTKHKIEIEDIKHLYKILKESRGSDV